jgi:hypothetical protein
MKLLVLLNVIVFSFIASIALSNEYWPTIGNHTYHYEDAQGNEIEVDMHNGQRFVIRPGYYMQQIFITDESGNVDMLFWEGLNTSVGHGIPWGFFMSPPLRFLPASLEVGQTGHYTTEAEAYGSTFPVWCSWEVVAEETVEVPAGTFDTIVLEVDPGSEVMISGTYYLCSGVGPVILPDGFQLVGIDGVIPTSQTTWGSVKSLYR